MNKGPIGIWLSVALLIFLLSLWLGYEAGAGIAHIENPPQLWKMDSLNNVEKQQLEATLSALMTLHNIRFKPRQDKEKQKSALEFEIDRLKDLKAQPAMQSIKPLIDMHLAMAYIDMSVVQQRGDDQTKAHEYMESGTELLRSLGWRDCSEETLKAAAQTGIYAWALRAPGKGAEN